METQKPLLKDEDGEEVDVHLYRSMIGSLMYLTSSRPDIMFVVCQPKLGLWYPKDSPFDFVAYTDSDYAGASLDRKFTTGGCQFLRDSNEKKLIQMIKIRTNKNVADLLKKAFDAKMVYGEVQLQALVDGKKIIVIEPYVRRDLQLEDAEGVDCLPNATIFEQLTLIGKQKSRRPKEKDTQAPQSSVPSDPTNIADEAVIEETSMQLKQLMDFCTKLQQRMLDLENTKTAQAQEIISLKKRVKKLEKKGGSITHKLKRLYKIGRSTRVVSSEKASLGDQEDASKYERKIDDIDADTEITLVDETQGKHDDDLMFDTGVLNDEEVFVGEDMAKKEVSTVDLVTTASEVVTTANVEVSTANPVGQGSKDKGKAKMIEPKKHLKKKDQIKFDEDEALRLQAKFDEEDRLAREKSHQVEEANIAWDDIQAKKRRKYFAAKREEEKRNRPPTKAQQRSFMCTYLKNMEGWKPKDLKNKSFANIQELIIKAMKRRAGEALEQESSKKQKVDDDKETEELKQCIEIISDHGDDVTIEATPLSIKSPTIVDYKIYKEGKKSYFQIIRANGNSQMYLTFGKMLKNFYKEDLEVLWSIVKVRFKKTEPVNYMDTFLHLNLKTMYEHHLEDNVWKNQQALVKVLNWKLYDSCGVHCVTMQNILYYMLVEKMYPLTKHTLHQMFNDVKLQVDYECEMAFELLILVKKQLKEVYGRIVGIKCLLAFTAAKNDLILAYEGASHTRDTKTAALRLKFNAFKSLEGEKVMGTFTRLKCLLNDLENNGVTIPQAEVNATFVNSLPRKWLSMNQTQRANNSIKDDSLATLYGKYIYEEALLANQKRFYKRSGRVRSTKKPIDKTKETCFAYGKTRHFQKDYPSNKTSTPSYPSSNNSFNKFKSYTPPINQTSSHNTGNYQKDYKGKYKGLKAEMAVLTQRIDDLTKGKSEKGKSDNGKSEKGLIDESFEWDKESVSLEDERTTMIRAFMAIAEDEPSVGKADARSGQWVDVTMKKVHKLLPMTDSDDRKHVLDYTHVDLIYVEDQRTNMVNKYNPLKQELSLHKYELSNLKNIVSINCSLQNEFIRVNLENGSLKDEISDLKRVIEKWTCSKVTLYQLLSEQIPSNIVKSFRGKGRRKENNPSKEVLFTKADISTSESAPMITSDSEDDSDIQESLPSLPKLTEEDSSGASKSLISLSDLTANMANLTLNTAFKEIKKSSNKVSQTYVIKKRTESKHPAVQNSCPNKNVVLSTEQLLLTLMEEVKGIKKHILIPSNTSSSVSQACSSKTPKQKVWYGPYKHYGMRNHLSDDCYSKPKCSTCGSISHTTKEHTEQTAVRKSLNKLKGQSTFTPIRTARMSKAFGECKYCGSNKHHPDDYEFYPGCQICGSIAHEIADCPKNLRNSKKQRITIKQLEPTEKWVHKRN
ncbi:hypothetical protein Tco_0639776 [Tanacetum coccineum]